MDIEALQCQHAKQWAAERLDVVGGEACDEDVMYRDLLSDYRAWCLARKVPSWQVKGMSQFATWLQFEHRLTAYTRRNASGPKWHVKHYAGARLKASAPEQTVI